MDPTLLAQALAILLAGAPTLLGKLGEKAAEKAAEKAGEGLAAEVWRRLRSADGRGRVEQAAEDLAAEPEDDWERRNLALQIERLLQSNADLARTLHELVPKAAGGGYQVVASGEAMVAQDGSVVARQVAVGRDVHGNVIQLFVDSGVMSRPEIRQLLRLEERPSDAELEAATDAYLRHLYEMHRYLELRGMGITDQVALKLPLLDLFVPLEARVATPEGEAWRTEERLAGRRPSQEEIDAMGERGKPHQVLDLLDRGDGLVVLGDPGAGKTTLLKFLAVTLASGQGGELGLGERLPVMLPLSAYARSLAQGEVTLDAFAARYYRELGVDLPLDAMLERALSQGRALLLFDGLDEVRDTGHRRKVVDRVRRFFALHRSAGNKFVISSRIVGYREVRPQADGLEECTLVDFGADEIETFVDRWVAAIERAAGGGEASERRAATEKRELLAAVRRSPGVRTLASNPLLLTILALMKRGGVSLPERRVDLYQNYVETLIKHWNLARSLDGPAQQVPDLHETLKVLAPLALWMHETSPGVGLVPEAKVRRRLEEIYTERGAEDPAASARAFLRDVRDHACLLLDRGGRQYGFIHLTFQEYLAAVALARRGQIDPAPVIEALVEQVDEAPWHEVARLTVGVLGLVQGRDEAADAVVRALAEAGEPGAGITLAGQAVADVWPGGVTDTCRREIRDGLLTALSNDREVSPPVRAAAGDALAAVGEARREVIKVDAMQFCWVPAGPFRMGGDQLSAEKPIHTVELGEFRMGRFPVTVGQFEEFLTSQGHLDAENRPGIEDDPANRPIRAVSWHEARDFCAWLTERWRKKSWLPEDWWVRLPSEAEWEKAARGGSQIPAQPVMSLVGDWQRPEVLQDNDLPERDYPWGERFDSNRSNGEDTEINTTNAVGCFPGGRSACGCEEMSGNVWEWTSSLWGKGFGTPEWTYPYRVDDGRENAEAPDEVLRVVRGGSFVNGQQDLRCASRNRSDPNDRYNLIGFRVVLAPFSGL